MLQCNPVAPQLNSPHKLLAVSVWSSQHVCQRTKSASWFPYVTTVIKKSTDSITNDFRITTISQIIPLGIRFLLTWIYLRKWKKETQKHNQTSEKRIDISFISISKTAELYRQRSKLWFNNAKWNIRHFIVLIEVEAVRKLVTPVGTTRSEKVNYEVCQNYVTQVMSWNLK